MSAHLNVLQAAGGAGWLVLLSPLSPLRVRQLGQCVGQLVRSGRLGRVVRRVVRVVVADVGPLPGAGEPRHLPRQLLLSFICVMPKG